MRNIIILILPALLLSKTVKVDEILTEKNNIKSTLSISYTNLNRKNDKIIPISYQTTNGDFVNIPTYVGSSSTNQDFIRYGFNLKYGITKNLEVYSNVNLFTNKTRSNDTSFSSTNSNGFNNINLGITYQVKHENETPSLLIGGNTNLIERTIFKDSSSKDLNFKSYSIFATSYYSVDPIVFLINARYRFNLEKENGNQSIKNGNIFTLSPSIVFAVNPYTSLSCGINYQFKNKDKVTNKVVSNSESSIGYRFGVSYELDSKKYLNFNVSKRDTNDYSSDSMNLAFTYKF